MYVRTLTAAALLASAASMSTAGGFAEPVVVPFVPAPVPAAAPAPRVHDWSGLYGGAFVSYTRGDLNLDFDDDDDDDDFNIDGGVIGLRAGYNRQMGVMVTGGDISISTGVDTDDGNDLDVLLTARARAGRAFGATGRTLGYVAGGLALGAFEDSNDDVSLGYTVGIGVERAVTENLSIYAEVNYLAIGDIEFDDFDGDSDFTRVNLGVNYNF